MPRHLPSAGWSCLAFLAACSSGSEPAEPPGPAVALELVSGTGQRVAPGADAEPLVVRAVDSAGRRVPDVPVTFNASPGDGTLLDQDGTARGHVTVKTSADGSASAMWRSSHTQVPDTGTVSVTSPSLPAVSFLLVIGYPEPPPGPVIAAGSTFTCDGFRRPDVVCWGSVPLIWKLAAGLSTISAFEGTVCTAAGEGRQCFGDNSAGQFGDGSSGAANGEVVTIDDGHRFLSLAIGGRHGCGIDQYARLYCWSGSSTATLSPSSTLSGRPERVAQGYSQVASGHDFMCALHVSGEVHCRGSNSRGQLGGAVTDGFSRLSGPYVQVVASQEHACALREDGRAFCWGRNDAGQLGDGSTSDRAAPSAVSGNLELVSIATGRSHTCGLDAEGRAFCWGSNASGELGDGTFNDSAVPVLVSASFAFEALALGDRHSCGLLTDGRRACWGETALNAVPLGRGFIDPVRIPIENADALWHAFSRGYCARTPSGVYCWGGAALQEFPQASGMQSIAWSVRTTCGLLGDGSAMCWGDNEFGQLGDGTVGGSASSPAPAGGALRFRKLVLGRGHACGLTVGSEIWCWGDNQSGQLGDGAAGAPSGTPRRIAGASLYSDLAAGDYHTCALDSFGRAHCWGSNQAGQLGDLSKVDRAAPVPIAGTLGYAAIHAFHNRSCALTAAGEAYCWGGGNNAGALGYRPDPNPCGAFEGECSWTPAPVQTHARFTTLGLSTWHSCGIGTDDVTWCWGDWSYGTRGATYLGGDPIVPNRILADLRFEELAAGRWTNCGRTLTGEIHCWGRIDEWTSIVDFSAGMPRPFRF